MTKLTTADHIRAWLRVIPGGMSVPALHAKIGGTEWKIRKAINTMPDVYIDHFSMPPPGTRGPRVFAVFCLSDTPQKDCPRPDPILRKPKRTQ